MLNFNYPDIEIPKGTGFCLDLGCGSGKHRQQIEDAGYQWVGVDIDTSRGAARLIEGDAHSLPFKSGVFNLVWMNCVLEHVGNPWLALSEIHRVLAKRGVIAGVSGYLDPDSTHMCSLTCLGLKKVFTDVGFKDLELSPGTIVFPVILRKYFMYLFGDYNKYSTRFGFAISKCIFIPFNVVYFSVGWLRNVVRKDSLTNYRKRVEQRFQKISRDFAAYWIFQARKRN